MADKNENNLIKGRTRLKFEKIGKMETSSYRFNYNGSLLTTVPAVHFRSAFAGRIHQICRDKKLRPDAIAVELGHPVVTELVDFLKYLQQGSSKKRMLPCMMGLLVKNHFIHPQYQDKAMLLQEFYNSTLNEIPEEVLAERLNFNKWATLYLSPTDSIIESVRCAIELDIPVYGVDLTHVAA